MNLCSQKTRRERSVAKVSRQSWKTVELRPNNLFLFNPWLIAGKRLKSLGDKEEEVEASQLKSWLIFCLNGELVESVKETTEEAKSQGGDWII